MKLAALSVDLDEIPCYHAIQGLEAPSEATAHAVYARATQRYRDLFAELSVPCTFFVIGADMDHAPSLAEARALTAAGHELGNHTFSHRYDLTRLGRARIAEEITRGADAVERAFGRRPPGFRAPGYTISDEVFDALENAGVEYDSSVFPCPMYWGAKAGFISYLSLRGRRSRSIVDDPRVLSAPADPYVPDRPYWRRARTPARRLVELPIGVTRGARAAYIGTWLMVAGPDRARWLTAMMQGRPLVNLELHGIDVLGAKEDGLEALAEHQRDLHVPVEQKLATLRNTVQQLARAGYRFVTLFEAAKQFRAD